MGTLDQEWAFDAMCQKCDWKDTVSDNAYQNPIWVCPKCKRLHNIVTDPGCIKYKKDDVKRKAELQKMYGDKFSEQEPKEVS